MAISAPLPKIECDRTFILRAEFVVGAQQIALNALQTMRGYMQRRLAASMFRARRVRPIDLPMEYSNVDGLAVN